MYGNDVTAPDAAAASDLLVEVAAAERALWGAGDRPGARPGGAAARAAAAGGPDDPTAGQERFEAVIAA
ncbi:MAG TPA: hypothetical protein VF755_27080, partial [Catenuloplanes sp.]